MMMPSIVRESNNSPRTMTMTTTTAAAAAAATTDHHLSRMEHGTPESPPPPPAAAHALSPQTSGVPMLLHSNSGDPLHPNGHTHYSQRSPWLRALVLGANDGLISIASLMVGVSAVKYERKALQLSGIAGLIAGACSMAIGEFVSVHSQRDTELADLEKEKQEHLAGPEAAARELEELAQIYVGRGLSYYLAKQVAEELSNSVDRALKAHARDELGIDPDGLSNPLQAAVASALAFSVGGVVPLLAGGFLATYRYRLTALVVSSTAALAAFGAVGAKLGGAPMAKAAARVTFGGWAAMLITYGVLYLVSIIT